MCFAQAYNSLETRNGYERVEKGQRIENGDCLVEHLSCDTSFGYSFFENRENWRWTWDSVNGTTHVDIDHMITKRKWCLLTTSFVPGFCAGSNHCFLRAKDRREPIHFNSLPASKTINVNRCCVHLDRRSRVLSRQYRRDLIVALRQREPACRQIYVEEVAQTGLRVAGSSACSPDLSPSGYHLFQQLCPLPEKEPVL
ncbi:hypothetical protein KIN20_020488 [Parelaphostrongylus tenuis]|uniref:Uncharacterized protein n=1 Tax=Parelaphostrongylus tenuis TaxID=148309 RepID=A0AAD5QTJ1_PARTN|nr:hypothetical protein KIN20_020488 [Parelaphostrongylus tenuis]